MPFVGPRLLGGARMHCLAAYCRYGVSLKSTELANEGAPDCLAWPRGTARAFTAWSPDTVRRGDGGFGGRARLDGSDLNMEGPATHETRRLSGQQSAESCLLKMIVGRERIGQTILFHDVKGDAVDERPILVRPGGEQIETLAEKRLGGGNDPGERIGFQIAHQGQIQCTISVPDRTCSPFRRVCIRSQKCDPGDSR